MPITFNQTAQAWELTNATEEEKTALLEVAKDFLIHEMGRELAQNIMTNLSQQGVLEQIPTEEMGNA